MSIGVPIKVLHEAEGHIVTCETNTGEVYRGKLIEAEDNMNCQVTEELLTHPVIPPNTTNKLDYHLDVWDISERLPTNWDDLVIFLVYTISTLLNLHIYLLNKQSAGYYENAINT